MGQVFGVERASNSHLGSAVEGRARHSVRAATGKALSERRARVTRPTCQPKRELLGKRLFRFETLASGHILSQLKTAMFNTKILNPHLLSLLARVRHTNMLVIADRGFPSWPQIETVDISLMDDVPTVLQVLGAIRHDFRAAQAYMAKEFLDQNTAETRECFAKALDGVPLIHEVHVELKKRVPLAIGLIRTGDTVQYANMILVSG